MSSWNLDQILNVLKKKTTLIAHVFPKLRTPKDVIRWMSKKLSFGRLFHRQHGKWSQTLLKSPRQHLYHNYWSAHRKFSWKKSPIVICKILRFFLHTSTADDKYFLLFWSNIDLAVLDLILNILNKKMTFIAYVFPILRTGKDVVRAMSISPLPEEDPVISNMVNGHKHCWNLPDSTFIIFHIY